MTGGARSVGEAPLAGFAQDAERRLRAIGDELARTEHIREDTAARLRRISARLAATPESAVAGIDPYLALSIYRGAIEALTALSGDPRAPDRRRSLRVAVERMRQGFRDVLEGHPIGEDRHPKEVARWLAEALDVPQAAIARLVGASPRTFARWIAARDGTVPQADDARRLRIVARITEHLRHVLTGPGVLRWFERPHPGLGRKTPADLLDRSDALPRLLALASAARSSGAA